ncbi:selenide, water dikinase SelD [Roseivivax sp.]
MHQPPLPKTRDLVLVGGGHTHALVLRKWAMDPLPGARLTLIDPGPVTAYSGMLPGHVAGHYTREALDIDLVRLARAAGARLILGAATAVSPGAREVTVPGRPPVGYDVLSLDVGVTSAMPGLKGFGEHSVGAKPLGPFADRWRRFLAETETGRPRAADRESWQRFLAESGPARVVVIGGGVAGVELALAMAHALRQRPAEVVLLERETLLAGLSRRARARLRAALEDYRIRVSEYADISEITPQSVVFSDGRELPAALVVGAAGARPHPWVAEMGLPHDQGFLSVSEHLQSGDPAIFAAGDCAHLAFAPRPKAGVYAVRAAPVLYDNLRAALGAGEMRPYRPQRDYLKLVSLGRQAAMGERFGLTFSGAWVWRWKTNIDLKFMQRFRELPAMPPAAPPKIRAAGLEEALGDKPLCGGCGAKVGQSTLSRALSVLGPPRRGDVTALPGDDAALLETGGTRQVLSTDHLRAFVEDSVLMTRIAAHHALGDILAMGAAPQAATLNLVLPRASDALTGRTLSEIAAAAAEVITAAGAEVVGGHSSLGDELTVGFSVTGLLERAPITLGGARPGDRLVLTKPIGSGTILAAEMLSAAPGRAVAQCWQMMCREQWSAAACLGEARAMTDVTGFGLIGHAVNIAAASGCGLRLELASVPLMPGAEALAQAGHHSSLYRENRRAAPHLPESPRHALLFDPQTAGGMLAALPPEATGPALAALREAGYPAEEIGTLTESVGRVDVV